ncbi:MAG: DNA (cytosine-5-)-methyltransferase [Planctomycetaceae bacterium]|nr:DNA (cytosine-5-)-methyltransferase [Planctomycetaceae bacterium]
MAVAVENSPPCRTLQVTAGNLKNGHLYVRDLDGFLPDDVLGSSRKSIGQGEGIEIVLDGLGESVITDVPRDSRSGKSRGFLRSRASVRRFFDHHHLKVGATLRLERLATRRYRLSVEPIARQAPRAAEFFSGIGLVRVALEQEGWRVVFANDIAQDKAQIYETNWPEHAHLVVGDIHGLDPIAIPDCELYTASFPCNDLSIAGRWDGLHGKESSAFWGLIRLLEEKGGARPPLVLIENVVGFLLRNGGEDLHQALRALNEVGYNVDAVVLNAANWTPQSRARLFIVAKLFANDAKRVTANQSDLRPDSLCRFINLNPDIDWDIQTLPPLPSRHIQLPDIIERLDDDDSQWWSDDRTAYFLSQLSVKHAEQAAAMIRGRSYSYATAFRRVRNGKSMAELRTDGIAGCLRTPRGGSGRQILFVAGRNRYRVRLLTARECARLQGVPEDYVIDVPLNQALFGFGDAVCVPAVAWLARHYLTPSINHHLTQR